MVGVIIAITLTVDAMKYLLYIYNNMTFINLFIGGFEVINPTQQCPLPRAAVVTQRSGRMIDIAMDQFFVDSALWVGHLLLPI
jgi:hypothetical protein